MDPLSRPLSSAPGESPRLPGRAIRPRPRRTALAAVLLALAVPASGQGAPAPLKVGDLYLHSNSFQGGSSQASALVRYDPLTGLGEVVVDTIHISPISQAAAHDPTRRLVLFVGSLGDADQPLHLYGVDGGGTISDLGLEGVAWGGLAPARDGKIYGFGTGPEVDGRIEYRGDDGQLHPLMAADGVTPFAFAPGSSFAMRRLVVHEPTRSLVALAGKVPQDTGCGTGEGPTALVARRVALSADGTRALGPVSCSAFDPSLGTGASVVPTGLSILPDGDLLVVTVAGTGAKPRLLRLDPLSLAFSVFATTGPYLGDTRADAGCWSRDLGAAVVLDTLSDDLRAYSEGSSGDGVLLGVSPPTGTPGLSGGQHTLLQIGARPCDGVWQPYGEGLVGSGGWTPVLGGDGCPEPGATVTLIASSTLGGAPAALFIGPAVASLPFKGGTLHTAPLLLTLPFGTGGTAGAAGSGSFAWVVPLPNDPGTVGASAFLQIGVADAAGPAGVALSPGLELRIG